MIAKIIKSFNIKKKAGELSISEVDEKVVDDEKAVDKPKKVEDNREVIKVEDDRKKIEEIGEVDYKPDENCGKVGELSVCDEIDINDVDQPGYFGRDEDNSKIMEDKKEKPQTFENPFNAMNLWDNNHSSSSKNSEVNEDESKENTTLSSMSKHKSQSSIKNQPSAPEISDKPSVIEPSAPPLDLSDHDEKSLEQTENIGKTITTYQPVYQPVYPALNAYESIIGYKIATSSLLHTIHGGKWRDIYALVWLQIDLRPNNVKLSDYGHTVSQACALQPRRKYCTNSARVLGIQFVGDPYHIKHALKNYVKGQGRVKSKFDPSFVYNPDKVVNEPNFGKMGKGGCLQGIHFYTDIKSAVSFGGCNGIDESFPIVTQRINGEKTVVAKQSKSWKERSSNRATHWNSSKNKLHLPNWVEVLQ